MNCKILPILSVLFALLIMAGCKDSVPDNIIQPGEMEDILYDYHVAQSMANGRVSDNLPYQERLYRDAVFKKYDITSADFDSSMVYYMRHTQILKGIYGNLAKRLSDDALKLGLDRFVEKVSHPDRLRDQLVDVAKPTIVVDLDIGHDGLLSACELAVVVVAILRLLGTRGVLARPSALDLSCGRTTVS